MERNGVTLLIDSMSYQYLSREIDYKEDIEGATVRDQESNATTTCGCGRRSPRKSRSLQNVTAPARTPAKKTGARGARFDSRGFAVRKRCTMPASKPRVPTPVWFDPEPESAEAPVGVG